MGDLVARTPRLTAAAILASLLTVDGAGSGLDADMVDGREPGSASGLATLDSGGKVPLSQLPDTVIGAVEYQGSWNASTNSPNLGGLSPSKGDYYVVSTGGTTSLGGITDWAAGDWAIYNGAAWQKVDNTDAVTSVAGRTGVVVLAASDIASGTLAVARGGTGLSTVASGALLYASALDTVSGLAVGTAGKVLTSSGTAPQWSSSIDVTGTIRAKGAAAAGIQIDPNAATGNFTLSLSPANLTANRRWTFGDADGTAAAINIAQTWTATQTFDDDKLVIRGGTQGATTPKALAFEVDTQAVSSTLTVDVGAQTTSRILKVPVLGGTRTLAVIDQDNAFTAAQTITSPTGLGLSIVGAATTLGQSPDLRFKFTGDPDAALSYLIYGHDNQSIAFDAYFNGTDWIASSTSSVLLSKASGQLQIFVNTGATKGSSHTATNFAMQIRSASVSATSSTTGTVTIGDGATAAACVSIGQGNIVAGGQITIDGSSGKSLRFTNAVSNGAVAVTFAGVGPTGSTAGNPQGWLRFNVAGTDRYMPFW